MKSARVVSICIALGLVWMLGCASTHENVAEHHHHPASAQFDGKCAYSVENGKFNVEGRPEFNLDHNGVTYYFSNAEARDKFKDHMEEHVERARRSWEGRNNRH